MLAQVIHKKILIISDSDRLTRAIEVLLMNGQWVVEKLSPNLPVRQREPLSPGEVGLIVVATSSPASEPVALLAQAALTQQIGQTPLLIISDRPFASDPASRVMHLDFPFDIDELRGRVKKILQRQ